MEDRANTYIQMYREWAKNCYTPAKAYNQLCDFYSTLSEEERTRATNIIMNEANK